MKEQVISAYSAIFTGADSHEWDKVQRSFAEDVYFDYSSLSGISPSTLTRDEIVNSWKSFLPGFNQTMHFLANHEVVIDGNEAKSSCYGHALHIITDASGGSTWEVFGFYQFDLRKTDNFWEVVSIRYLHKYETGNRDLPRLAIDKLKEK